LKEKIIVAYVGLDKRYWQNVQEEFELIYGEAHEFEFVHLVMKAEEHILKYYRVIRDRKVQILFLDFNTYEQQVLKLAKTIRRDSFFSYMTVIGLFSFQQAKSPILKDSFLAGIMINHIKLNDVYDSVFDAYTLLNFENHIRPPFFLARFKGQIFQVKETVRVNYLSTTEMGIETNHPLERAHVVSVGNNLDPEIVPSQQFMVKSVQSHGHYYNYLNCAVLDFLFVDQLGGGSKKDAMALAEMKDKEETRAAQVIKAKEDFRLWLKTKEKDSVIKSLRLLVIDRNLNLLSQADDWIGNLPYSFRAHGHIMDVEDELNRFRPSIITVQYFEKVAEVMAEPTVEEKKVVSAKPDDKMKIKLQPEVYNDEKFIESLVAAAKKIPQYKPIIVVFGYSKKGSGSLQKQLGYEKIMVNAMDFELDALMSMGSLFENKNKFFNPMTITNKVFIEKNDDLSIATINYNIEVVAMSESVIYFSSAQTIAAYSVFELENPAKLHITVVPMSNSESQLYPKAYKGLIHAFDKEQKDKLRKFIISEGKK